MAKVNVCFACLKGIQGSSLRPGTGGDEKRQDPKIKSSSSFPMFWNFSKEYLQVASAPFEKECFCEDCASVVGSICQLYQNLLQVQHDLSSRLGEFGELLEHSERTFSNKLGRVFAKSMAYRLGIATVADVDEMRNFLKDKCKLPDKTSTSCILYCLSVFRIVFMRS